MVLVRELKRKTLKLKLDGEEYKVLFPSARQLSDFQEEFSKEQKLGKMIDFVVKLGLPLDAAESLEAEHLREIFELLSGQKKS
jgi:hypothetical protein